MKTNGPRAVAVPVLILMASLVSLHAATTVTFRDGVDGYAGTQDTFISSGSPTTDEGASTTIEIDQAGAGGEFLLLRFDDIFGTGTNQIPPRSKILFASLTITIVNTGNDPAVHQMLVPWNESSTWDSMVDGILADDVEAAMTPDTTFPGNGATTVIPLPVSTLQGWSDGSKTNFGWVVLPSGSDGTDFSSSENSVLVSRPLLTVVWGTVDEAFVKSVSPLNGATDVPVDANIVLTITDAATKLNTNSVQLFVNNQSVRPVMDQASVPGETILTYDPPTDFPPTNKVTVRLIYSDNATPPHTSTNDFSFTTRANTLPLVLIDDKQLWKYDRSGADLGTTWKERIYTNDSAWPEGLALIGQDSSTVEPLRTPIERFNDAGEYVQTFYFRTYFNYTGPLGGDLLLRHVIDDGAVFYLNGTEIHRFGIAAGATFDYLTSFAGHENMYEGPFVIPGDTLLRGTNVFAAEVHQSGTSSSDFVFGAELLTTISGLRPTSIGTIIPAPNSTEVSPGAIIEINLSDGTQQVQTNSIQLSVNGQAVSPQIDKPTGGRTTKITYDPPGNLPLESLVTVRLVFRDDATPPNVTTNEFSFTTRPEFTILFAIDDRQMWRYDRSGLDLGTAWKERIYTNETAWPEGAALLADETAAVEPIRTTISRFDNSGVTQVTTFYFRTHFNFTNNPATARLRIRHVVDDGVVVYLNGEEVHRFGLAPGLTFSNTTFFAGHENAYEGPFFISTASLVQGDNVLAAEVHQSDPTSSDIVFGLELQLVTSSPPAGLQFTSVTRSGSNILIEWTGTATLESADALSGAWTPVAGATSPYPAANTGAAKFFRLRQ